MMGVKTHMNLQQLHSIESVRFKHEWGVDHEALTLAEELIAVTGFSWRRSHFCCECGHWEVAHASVDVLT